MEAHSAAAYDPNCQVLTDVSESSNLSIPTPPDPDKVRLKTKITARLGKVNSDHTPAAGAGDTWRNDG